MTKGYHHLTPEQEDEIVAVYDETKSTRITADQLGWDIQRVRYCLKRKNIPLTHKGHNACSRNRALLLSLVEQGTSLSEIARQIGANRRHVKAYLELHEISYDPYSQSGENNPNWKGGRRIDADGYVLIYCPDHPYSVQHGCVREHRLVMETAIGRYLLPEEVIHHIDGNKQNNQIENLRLYPSNGEHLTDELTGCCPNWSEDGKRRIQEGVARSVAVRHNAIPD